MRIERPQLGLGRGRLASVLPCTYHHQRTDGLPCLGFNLLVKMCLVFLPVVKLSTISRGLGYLRGNRGRTRHAEHAGPLSAVAARDYYMAFQEQREDHAGDKRRCAALERTALRLRHAHARAPCTLGHSPASAKHARAEPCRSPVSFARRVSTEPGRDGRHEATEDV